MEKLNVFSNDYINKLEQKDAVTEIANMINNSGKNRAQRRRLEKGLCKVTKLSEKAQKKLDYSAYEEYKEVTDKDFVHFNAVLALVMYEDYGWKETAYNDHGQITSLMERIQKKMHKLKNEGLSTEDICNRVEELTGIILMSDYS